MRSTLEAIFRHPLLLLILLMSLPIAGVAVAYIIVPRTYQSTASVWALQRYFVVGATGPESDLTSTPAQTQAAALNELLQTRAFSLAVAKGINLGPTLDLSDSAMNDPQQLGDALYNDISKHVVASPLAYNLYNISYTNHDPKIAQEVVKSVIVNFGTQSLGLSIVEGQNLLTSYQTQLANVQKDLNDTVTTETRYVATHPGLKLGSDPQYELLDTQRVQALANVQSIQDIINKIQQSIFNTQGTGTTTLFQVIDSPQIPNRPESRTKNYLTYGGIGLAFSLLACVIYLVIVVRRDRGVVSSYDLQGLVTLPVIMQLPNLTTATVSLLTPNTMHGRPLLTDEKNSTNGHLDRK